MNQILIFLLLPLLAISCGSTKSGRQSEDFTIEYLSRSDLMGSETRIEVRRTALTVTHSERRSSQKVDGTFSVTKTELDSLKQLVERVRFHEMALPPSGKVLDAPEEVLSASYDGRTTRMSIGAIAEKPKEIQEIRRHLFMLASKYSDGMKQALGY